MIIFLILFIIDDHNNSKKPIFGVIFIICLFSNGCLHPKWCPTSHHHFVSPSVRTSQIMQPLAPPACTHRAARTTTTVGKKHPQASTAREPSKSVGMEMRDRCRPPLVTSGRRILGSSGGVGASPIFASAAKEQKSEREQSK